MRRPLFRSLAERRIALSSWQPAPIKVTLLRSPKNGSFLTDRAHRLTKRYGARQAKYPTTLTRTYCELGTNRVQSFHRQL